MNKQRHMDLNVASAHYVGGTFSSCRVAVPMWKGDTASDMWLADNVHFKNVIISMDAFHFCRLGFPV